MSYLGGADLGRVVLGRPPESPGGDPYVGAPVRTLAGPFSYRPDSVVDGWDSASVSVRAASVRGDSHRLFGTPRQDEMSIVWHEEGPLLVIAVADGVSAAPQSHVGAAAACRYATEFLMRSSIAPGAIDWESLLRGCAWNLVQTAQRLTGATDPDPADAEAKLATTLAVAVVWAAPDGLVVEGTVIGDSGLAVVRDGAVEMLLGAKRSPEDGIVETAVAPLPRVPEVVAAGGWQLAPHETLLVGTDGVWDPVGDGSGPVGRFLAATLGGSALPDRLGFLRTVDFYRETHDDDRTLVAVRLLAPSPGDDPSGRLGDGQVERQHGHGEEATEDGHLGVPGHPGEVHPGHDGDAENHGAAGPQAEDHGDQLEHRRRSGPADQDVPGCG